MKVLSESPDRVQVIIIKRTLIVALLPLIASLLTGELSGFMGLLLGLIISLLLFRLKALNIQRALEMNSNRATGFIRNRYFVNYFIYFFVLVTAYRKPELNFLATAIGLLLLKFTIIGSAVVELIKDKWKQKMESLKGGIIDESRT